MIPAISKEDDLDLFALLKRRDKTGVHGLFGALRLKDSTRLATFPVDRALLLPFQKSSSMVEKLGRFYVPPPPGYFHVTADPFSMTRVVACPVKERHYYHATQLLNLEGILKSGQVEVREEKYAKGAYVSTRPEEVFGDFVLVFKTSIEEGASWSVSTPFVEDNKVPVCWMGLKEPIPVNAATLECVAVRRDSEVDLETAERRCSEWAGRPVRVVPLESLEQSAKVSALKEGICVPVSSEMQIRE